VVRYAPLLYALNRAEILQYPQDGNIRRPWHTFWREARMAPQTRAKLVAEIAKLRRQQSDDLAEGMFCGWTVEQEAEHRTRRPSRTPSSRIGYPRRSHPAELVRFALLKLRR